MKNLCREYTLLRCEETSCVRGWIRGNTKIDPVLSVMVCFHQGRYGVEIMAESLFRDRTVSWVRIVNGIDKHVTETSQTIPLESVEHRVTEKPVAKAKPRPMPLVRERNWIDCQPREIPSRFEKMMEQYGLTILWKNQGKVRWYFAVANYRLDNLSGKRRRTKEKVSILLEPSLFLALIVFPSNSGTFRR